MDDEFKKSMGGDAGEKPGAKRIIRIIFWPFHYILHSKTLALDCQVQRPSNDT